MNVSVSVHGGEPLSCQLTVFLAFVDASGPTSVLSLTKMKQLVNTNAM